MSCQVNLVGLPSGLLEEVFTPQNINVTRPASSPLVFPRSRSALWDQSPAGDVLHTHLCQHRYPKVVVLEKVLRLAQRHARQSNKTGFSCFLLGSLSVDIDEECVTVTLDRFDPGWDQVPRGLMPGDVLVPCVFVEHTDTHTPEESATELHSAWQAVQNVLCGRDPAVLAQLIQIRLLVSCSQQGDRLVSTLYWEAVTSGSSLDVEPIRAIPVIPTALVRALTGPDRLSTVPSTKNQRGYLTMDQGRKLLLLLESDPKASHLPLLGVWVGGVTKVSNPKVWAWSLNYLCSSALQDRVMSDGRFMLVLFPVTHSRPQFYQCQRFTGEMKCQLLTGTHTHSLYQNTLVVNGSSVQCELSVYDQTNLFSTLEHSVRPGLSISDQDSGLEEDDLSPRPSPNPHPHSQQSRRVQPCVPELSLLMDVPHQHAFTPITSLPTPIIAPPTRKPSAFLGNKNSPNNSSRTSLGPLKHSTPHPANASPANSPHSTYANMRHPDTTNLTSNLHLANASPTNLPRHANASPTPNLPHPANASPTPNLSHPANASPTPNLSHPANASPIHNLPHPANASPTNLPRHANASPTPNVSHLANASPTHNLSHPANASPTHNLPHPANASPTILDNPANATIQQPAAANPTTNVPACADPSAILAQHSNANSIANLRHPASTNPAPGFSHIPGWRDGCLCSQPTQQPEPTPPCTRTTPGPSQTPYSCLHQGVMWPPEAFNILLNQDRQLRVLQAQIKMLLEAQGSQSPTATVKQATTPAGISTTTASIAVETGASLFWGSAHQHPFPSTPQDHSRVEHGSSPVLGESASMFRTDTTDQQRFYQDLLGQVSSRLQESGGAEESSSRTFCPSPYGPPCSSYGLVPAGVQPSSAGSLERSHSLDTSVELLEASVRPQEDPGDLGASVAPREGSVGGRRTSTAGPEAAERGNSCVKGPQGSPAGGQGPAGGHRVSAGGLGHGGGGRRASVACQETSGEAVVSATLRQLQQLGVCVDLVRPSRPNSSTLESTSTLARISPEAVLSRLSMSGPGSTHFPACSASMSSEVHPSCTADLSLEANAIARRYLPYAHQPRSPGNLLSPSNMSLATRAYMRRYGLLEEKDDDDDDEEEKEDTVQDVISTRRLPFLPQSQLIRDLRPKMELLGRPNRTSRDNKENHGYKRPPGGDSEQTERTVGNFLDLSRLRQLPKLF